MIRVRVDGQDERLKPGMTARVRLALDRRDDVVRIPRGALFTDTTGASVVFPRESWPQPRRVRTGLLEPRWVEALEGVREGDALSSTAPPEAGVVPWGARPGAPATERDTVAAEPVPGARDETTRGRRSRP